MLGLTRKCEYALMALCHLVHRGPHKVVSARDIAAEHGMPLSLLMNVLKELHQARLIRSVRGAHGGYALARDPATVSLAELLLAIDGPIRLVPCAESANENEAACELRCRCTIRTPLLKVHERLKSLLETITIADVAGASARPLERGCVPVELTRNGYETTNLSRQ